jgi:mannosylglycerate hydrolase
MTNLPTASDERDDADAGLAKAAMAILDENWLGHATRPGRLYPHQWSWDAACIAMGRAAADQARAERELRSLFAGQWDNGLLPHIVFTDAEEYFPGAGFWQSSRSAAAPRDQPTSGIVQPPIHATAAWRLYRRAPDRDRAAAFLADLFPGLVAWHGYLYRERTRDGQWLAEVWHPWESGMDNSPAWDGALASIELGPDDVPEYTRVDNQLGKPAERPSDFDYDRYAYLVHVMRDLDYDAPRIRDACPFAVQPVLFNSLLIESNRDLARIALVLGEDPEPYERWADLTAAGMEELWDPDRAIYLDYDVRADRRVSAATAAGFAPLYAGVPSSARAARLIEQVMEHRAPLDDGMLAVPSIAPGDPRFDPALYWRGPVWPIFHWVVSRGVARYGEIQLAERIRRTALDFTRSNGFWEHYNPVTGRGQGDARFSWTAGLILDLLDSQSFADGEL